MKKYFVTFLCYFIANNIPLITEIIINEFCSLTFAGMISQKGEFCPIDATQVMASFFLKVQNIFPESIDTTFTTVIISFFFTNDLPEIINTYIDYNDDLKKKFF